MVRRTNVISAIDGILYDAQTLRNNGGKDAALVAFLTSRMKNLRTWLDREETYNKVRRTHEVALDE